ncbi:MAG: amidohydrolase family protein, partial [Opitutales bacterium]
MKTLLTAKWIAPVSRPLIEHGAIVIEDGRIIDIGPQAEVLTRHVDALMISLGHVLVLPGLVNAHTHLELSDVGRDTLSAGGGRPGEPLPVKRETLPAGGFAGWLRKMIARSIADPRELTARCSTATGHGIAQCLRFGVTCVGDITAQPAATRPVLARSPLRGVSFGEVRAMGANRALLEKRIKQATRGAKSKGPRIGLSPHAPYSVEIPGYERCLAVARESGIPMATHLAENPAEAEFLEHQTGPFRKLWNALPWWDERIPRFAGGPIRLAKSLGLLDFPAVLAHVNCCDDDELDLLARGRASVVYCPRTSAWFGHPPHRFREMLARGVNLALGTDSCASSPDLNLLEEARLVHRLAPDVPPETLLRMITLNGARALQWDGKLGSLDPGKYADVAVLSVTTNDPLREILEVPLLPDRVF